MTLEIARNFTQKGIKYIVALRGDPPESEPCFAPHPEGFKDTCKMIKALKVVADFNIFVGAYPHKHLKAKNIRHDVEWLKHKFDFGAYETITQFFFEVDDFFRFSNTCARAGITTPIVPGILPVENWQNTKKFAARREAQIPAWMDEIYCKASRDERSDLLSIALSTELCSQLIDGRVEALHFYTFSHLKLTRNICSALGVIGRTSIERSSKKCLITIKFLF